MPTVVHFDIFTDDMERAKEFYGELFDWKIELFPGPIPYYLIQTTDLNGNESVGGGLAKRDAPERSITNFIGVRSIDEYTARIEELGGKVVEPKWAVPGWGHLAICLDTENNAFGLWEEDENAQRP